MNSLREIAEQAIENDQVPALVIDIHTWEEEGQVLVGKVLDIVPFTEGEFEQECNKYQLQTEDGIVSTVMGAAADRQLPLEKVKDRWLYIRYKGKKQLGDGRHVNWFAIRDVTEAIEAAILAKRKTAPSADKD